MERPIGTFTGTTPVSIPIHDVTAGSIPIPLSLSYDNGGIRVEEIAGNVGLGWNLSGTFAIARSVRGVPDDNPGGFLSDPQRPATFNITSLPDLHSVMSNTMDLQPDLYFFNFNGRSGKFYFNQNREIVQVQQSGITIAPIYRYPALYRTIDGWIVTDELGVKYYFGYNKAQTKNYVNETWMVYLGSQTASGYPNYNTAHYSTWHLAEMRDINDINLATYIYSSAPAADFVSRSTTSRSLQVVAAGPGNPGCGEPLFTDEVRVQTYSTGNVLTAITTAIDSVAFYSSARLDTKFEKLDSINVYNKSQELKKRLHLNYGYFESTAPTEFNHDYFKKRLKLLNVSQLIVGGTDSLAYQFDYSTPALPHRFSNAVDYWGYYNGQDGNATLLPNGNYNFYNIDINLTTNGERRASSIYNKAGTLSKITFPTGGYREFVYEGNTAFFDGNSQILPDLQNNTVRQTIFDSIRSPEFPFVPGFPNPQFPAFQKEFIIDGVMGLNTFEFEAFGAPCTEANFLSRIYKVESGTEILQATFQGKLTGSISLAAGTYRFKFYFNNTCHFVRIAGRKSRGIIQVNAGGIRVKEIKDYDPITNKFNISRYKYVKFNDTVLTSGKLITPVVMAAMYGCGPNCGWIALSSQSQYPLTTEGRSYVVYTDVSVSEEGNGRRDINYSFSADIDGYSSPLKFPLTPPQDMSWKRGKPIAERVYNSSNTLIKKTVTLYPFIGLPESGLWDYPFPAGNDSTQWLMLPANPQYAWVLWAQYKAFGGQPCYTANPELPCLGCGNNYFLTSAFLAPRMKIETDYAGPDRIDTRTDYSYYTNLQRPILKQEKKFINNNKVKETTFTYAFNSLQDFTLPLTTPQIALKETLLQKNYLQPLQAITYMDQSGNKLFLQGVKNEFDYFNGTNIHQSAQKIFGQLTDSVIVSFSNYDPKGNLQEVSKLNDLRKSYLWGYDNTHLIADISNAPVKDVFYTSFEDNEGNVNNDARTGQKSRTGGYTKSLSNLTNGSYILTWWQKTGGTWSLQTSSNISVAAGTYSLNLSGQVDEVRFYPSKAQITTYTYNPLAGMTSQCDVNNRILYYEYDGFERLKVIRDENKNILKTIDYQYQKNNQ